MKPKSLKIQIGIFFILAGLLALWLLLVLIDGLLFNALGLSFYEEYFFRYLLFFGLLAVEIFGLIKAKKWSYYLGFILTIFLLIYTGFNLLLMKGPIYDVNYTILSTSGLIKAFFVWFLGSIILLFILTYSTYKQYRLKEILNK
ncbi:MAG: hypothetical protein AABX13_01185 [Nanoarchaeota archaeon]